MKTGMIALLAAVELALVSAKAQEAVIIEPSRPANRVTVLVEPESETDDRAPVDAVLFVQNHVGEDFHAPLSNIGDRIAAALSGDIFNVIDPNDAIGSDQNRGPWGENMPITAATRLAADLDAQAMITAAVDEFSVGGDERIKTVRMTLTLTPKRLPKGAAVGGVTVTESINTTAARLAANGQAVYSDLVGRVVVRASKGLLEKMANSDWDTTAPKSLRVFFGCNVLGADVQVDGLSLGTCPGQFSVAPGIHNVLVSYPPYYLPFERKAKFYEDGQTFAVVLQITPEGEKQRSGALEYEQKRAELDSWKRETDFDFEQRKDEAGFDFETKKRERDLEFDRKRKELVLGLAERSELFKKQLALADAMLDRYERSGEADDYVRRTIADGTAVYWKNSYGRIAITDGSTDNIEFATPATDTADLAVPPSPTEIGEGLQKLLLKKIER